ncbi:hypothetical protein [Micromonospora sp. NPDC005806]|uniref:hypothetical protein n=1 Tax=Micromonospora sp. NPDC005806 TaxID=3364234 RepID=UPI0036C362F2
MAALEVTLPRGLVDADGARHRDAVLLPPDGWLEAALVEAVIDAGAAAGVPGARLRPAVRHGLLAGSVDRIGAHAAPDAAAVASLTRGDADQLAYGLRRAVLGDRLALVLRCANPACREQADVDLALDDLLADDTGPEPEWFTVAVPGAEPVQLRAPTGADDEALAAVAGPPESRTAALLARLLPRTTAEDWSARPAPERAAILLALAELPAGPVRHVQVPCPSCGALMEATLDPLVVLARELRAGGDRLLLETHCLAYHYGWSEEEILGLPRGRRWGYLGLLRAQLTGAPLETVVGGG